MDCTLIVSANTWVTFLHQAVPLPADAFLHWLSKQHGWVRWSWVLGGGKLLGLAQVGTWRRRDMTSRAVTKECCCIKENSVFIVQVDWMLTRINTVLMKQKYDRIIRFSLECFNTCVFLSCLHSYVSFCCISHAKGQLGDSGYHNITLINYFLFPVTAKHRAAILISAIKSLEDKTESMRQWVFKCQFCFVCYLHY